MQLFFLTLLPFLAFALPTLKKSDDIPCGTQASGNEPIGVDGVGGRIIGGQHAKPHSWPWAAALMSLGSIVNCGATLIDKRWLISAGHCFAELGGGYHVKLGADDHGDSPSQNEPSQQVVGIEKYWVHPNYSSPPDHFYADWDITLVKLDQDVTLNEFVRPVCLPEATDQLQGGENIVTIGWGQTEAGGEPRLLQQVVMPIVDKQTCQDDYNYAHVTIDETMICAGNQTFGGTGSCFGDSGSALLSRRENKWIHYGITSWVGDERCALPKEPTVYGFVPTFVNWVKEIMQSESN